MTVRYNPSEVRTIRYDERYRDIVAAEVIVDTSGHTTAEVKGKDLDGRNVWVLVHFNDESTVTFKAERNVRCHLELDGYVPESLFPLTDGIDEIRVSPNAHCYRFDIYGTREGIRQLVLLQWADNEDDWYASVFSDIAEVDA